MVVTSQFLWRAGCFLGATGVALGAFGAHGLAKHVDNDPKKLKMWETAAHYQLFHSAVLLAASLGRKTNAAGPLLIAGTAFFSGSIYLLVLDKERFRPLGPVTPLGGLCLIGGWVALLF
ncbi:DUF423-domain-containing protein [Basidiobolus meristosporus CBS 931.73]|uniref:DUF423-domain-containing protein n=1 Tax=Basidiobolus meristosporus CBS 931.73 TaxID=1314790 RepID=A0A1Y1YYC4_9FUNG|nr:DUF423-domain-containing protein [Basidiobolus meristosporus CBS 931.73]|eukprot:ORY02884.1 DUF423-domain-containing protein [Basidiobolus meristosporus CBS 931.73]